MRCVLLVCVFTVAAGDVQAQAPQVTVSNIRRVFHNGEHNAFTDLVKFGGRYFLAFRSCPDGHMVHPTSSIIILVSDDLRSWDPVHRFHVPLRDTRDPHFLVFRDRLFVYTGTWYSGKTTLPRDDYDLNKHLGYAAWSSDGKQWHSPVMLEGTFGHYIWKAGTHGSKAYLNGRRKRAFSMAPRGEGKVVESVMLESDDGLTWRTRAMFQPEYGNETAFQFEPDGTIVAIGRRTGKAQLLRSEHPWKRWDRRELERHIGGPLLARWGQHRVVGGRKPTPKGPRTSMYWLIDGRLHEFAELPSGGDNSYPGFLELTADRAVMSWYSSHERDANGKTITAIYMADLSVTQPGGR